MSSKSTILTEHHNIQTPCKLFVVGEPQVLLVQPSARHEEKNDGVRREVELIAQASSKGFAMVFFDSVEWARALMPWADDAVSRDAEVGRHAPDTLRFIEHTLLPWLRERFGALPCIIGGYSLGGLFALWAARNTDAFAAVAAASPSLWIKGWGEYAAAHPILSPQPTIQNSKLKIQNSKFLLHFHSRHCALEFSCLLQWEHKRALIVHFSRRIVHHRLPSSSVALLECGEVLVLHGIDCERI